MQVHFSYQHGSPHSQLESIIENRIAKLQKLLVHFSPDLIHLHGAIEFGTTKQEPRCSLHLWLPTAQIHAKEAGSDLPVVVRAAFDHAEAQVKKHKEVLRHESERKKGKIGPLLGVQQEHDGQFQLNSRQRLREYLEQVLPQLSTFVSREIRFRVLAGARHVDGAAEEIENEVVAKVLENHREFAQTEAPFHGLIKEAIIALDAMLPEPLDSAREARVSSLLTNAGPVEQCLSRLPSRTRQMYILCALEGFSFQEAAEVLGGEADKVEVSVRNIGMEVSATIQALRPSASATAASVYAR